MVKKKSPDRTAANLRAPKELKEIAVVRASGSVLSAETRKVVTSADKVVAVKASVTSPITPVLIILQ